MIIELKLPDREPRVFEETETADLWDELQAFFERIGVFVEQFEIAKLINLAQRGISTSMNGAALYPK
jgi:hypothetical protein